MDHSLQAYLQRQSTEVLKGFLLYYSQQRRDEHTAQIIGIIENILLQRKSAN